MVFIENPSLVLDVYGVRSRSVPASSRTAPARRRLTPGVVYHQVGTQEHDCYVTVTQATAFVHPAQQAGSSSRSGRHCLLGHQWFASIFEARPCSRRTGRMSRVMSCRLPPRARRVRSPPLSTPCSDAADRTSSRGRAFVEGSSTRIGWESGPGRLIRSIDRG